MADTTLEVLFQLNSQLKGINDAINKTNELNKTQASLGKRLTDVSKKTQQTGKALSLGLTLPIVGAGIAATKYASDLQETLSKTEAIFKSSSADVIDWSKDSARAFGLSQTAALDAVSRFGGAFKEIGGLGEKEAGKLSQEFVGLSSDLNSFFNRSDAADALGSALTGEFEPLKKFNVIINDAILKQKALELGVYSGTGALDAQAKQAATVALIMEKTTDAQGDFARTSDGLANQTRILKAEFENAAAQIGTQLLPIATKLINIALQGIAAFNGLSPSMQKTVVVVAGLAAAIGPVLFILGSIIPVLGTIAAVISGPVVIAIAALVAGAAFVIQNWQAVKQFFTAFIQNIIAEFEAWRTRNASTITGIVEAFNRIKAAIGVIIAFLAEKIVQGIASLNSMLAPIGGLKGAWEILKESVRIVIDTITTLVGGLFNWIADVFTKIGNALDANESIWTNLGRVIGVVVSEIIKVVQNLVKKVVEFFTSIDWLQLGKDIMAGIRDGIIQGGKAVLDGVKNVASDIKNGFTDFFDINSPSVVMRQIGQFLMQGLGIGITEEGQNAIKAAAGVSQGVADATARAGAQNSFGAVTPEQASGLATTQGFGELQGGGSFIDQFAATIPTVDDQLQRLASGSLNDVSNGITGLIDGSATWGQVFTKIGGSILNTLVQIAVQRTAMFLLGQTQNRVATQTQVSSGAQIAAAQAPAAAASSIASYGAAGAIGTIAAVAGIAAIVAAVSGAFNEGGTVPGPMSPRDNQLILAASGERIIPNGPSQQYASLLDGIIAGRNPIDLIDIPRNEVSLSAGSLPEISVEPAGAGAAARDLNVSLMFEEQEFRDRIESTIDERVVSAFNDNKSQFI